MSLNSSSKPHSVANNLVGVDKAFNLVFKSGTQGKRLTQDALYVCQLLAINPEDLMPRDFESFAVKGLSDKRQLLRYEHYDEKRQLKLKAIQNVLLRCLSKEANGEAMQVQALIEDIKKQSQTSKHQYSPFKTQKYYNNGMANADKSVNIQQSQYLENQASKQMERVMEKLEKWQKIKEIATQNKVKSEEKVQKIMQKEKKKFESIHKNQLEIQEETKMKLEMQQLKWKQRVQALKDHERQEESSKMQKTKEIQNDMDQFFTSKMQKEKSWLEKINRPDLSRMNNSMDSYKRTFSNDREDQDKVGIELQQLELKLQRANERNNNRMIQIMNRGQNHSQIVNKRKEDHQLSSMQKQEEILSKSVKKAMRTKSKTENRLKEINRAAEKLQDIHRQKEEKIKRQQEEERQIIQQQLKYLSEKTNRTEAKIFEKKQMLLDQISGKKEKRKLQFEDKNENERKLKIAQMNMKQQIYEKYQQKEFKITEMKKVWLNNSQ